MTLTDQTDPKHLVAGSKLYALTEGNRPEAVAIVVRSVDYFQRFLANQQNGKLLTDITRQEIREFILYLQQRKCFKIDRSTPTQKEAFRDTPSIAMFVA